MALTIMTRNGDILSRSSRRTFGSWRSFPFTRRCCSPMRCPRTRSSSGTPRSSKSVRALSPAANGHRTVVTVIHDRALVTEQHVVKVKPNGIEMNDGIRLALQPAADGREAVVKISHDNELLSEQRVVKVM